MECSVSEALCIHRDQIFKHASNADLIDLEWKVGKRQKQEAVSFSQYVHPSQIRCDRMVKAVNRIHWTHLRETSGHHCDNSNESDLVKTFTQLKAKQTCCQSRGRKLRRPLPPGWVHTLRKEKERLGFLSLSSRHPPDYVERNSL